MPIEGVRYRVKQMPNGQKVRLAFDNESSEVVEAVALPPKKLRHKARAKRKR